jgi:gamma-butyrobetaine dioxygenase
LQLNSRALWTKARLLSAHSQATIASVHLKDKELAIRWSDNQISTLPYIYLRDNCQEPESLDQTAKQRVFNPAFTIDLNIKAKQVEMSEGGQQICLTWPDGHRSRFSSSWLAEHVEGMAPETPRLPVERKYWKSDYYESIPRFDFKKLANDDGTLLEFLLQMDSFGLVLVDNMGTDSNQLQKFCKLIAYPKPSVHG